MTRREAITTPRRRRSGILLAALILAAAACAGGGLPPPTASAPAAPVASEPAPSPAVEATPRPTEVPGPPGAVLDAGSGTAVGGELGSFSWDGLVSDAPWIVPADTVTVAVEGRLGIGFQPGRVPLEWSARWAPVTGAKPGRPVAAGRGTAVSVTLTAPSAAGPWSLQLDATFGEGRRGTWYWRLDVGG